MGLFNFLSGKQADEYERDGDRQAAGQSWGDAKLAFETALDKLSRQRMADPAMERRLKSKLKQVKESLAGSHRQAAEELIAAGCTEEAQELLNLALELTDHPDTKAVLADLIVQTQPRFDVQAPIPIEADRPDEPSTEPVAEHDVDVHFDLLLGALPDTVQQAYRSYGYHFKQGYLALNQRAFDQAVHYLEMATQENPSPHSLVPLELATAHVHLGQTATARDLLETLVSVQPDLLPAFQLLCDIYWEAMQFDEAMQLLDSLSPELKQSMGAYLLKGETLLRAQRHQDALTYFQGLMDQHGWHDPIAIGLARSHEGLDQNNEARDLYADLLGRCTGCGSKIDPAVRRKYADLSLATGRTTYQVLEHYLALVQEDPVNAAYYYHCASQIYTAQGDTASARRFQSIAESLSQQQQ